MHRACKIVRTSELKKYCELVRYWSGWRIPSDRHYSWHRQPLLDTAPGEIRHCRDVMSQKDSLLSGAPFKDQWIGCGTQPRGAGGDDIDLRIAGQQNAN